MAEVIHFSRSLYRDDAIDAAAAAYGELATISVETLADDIVVSVSDIDERVADRLVDAFCNHALFETASRSRVGSTN